MQTKWKEILAQFYKTGIKKKVPRHVLEAFCHIIKIECKGETNYEKRLYDLDVKEAIRQ